MAFSLQVECPEFPEDLQHWVNFISASSQALRAEGGLEDKNKWSRPSTLFGKGDQFFYASYFVSQHSLMKRRCSCGWTWSAVGLLCDTTMWTQLCLIFWLKAFSWNQHRLLLLSAFMRSNIPEMIFVDNKNTKLIGLWFNEWLLVKVELERWWLMSWGIQMGRKKEKYF